MRTRPRKRGRHIYIAAILLGLACGRLMIYFQNHPPAGDAAQHCGATSEKLAQAVHGEVAAFVPSRESRMLPRLSFEDDKGAMRTLEEFRGKTVLLNLWATWCVPCRTEMPALDALQQKKGGKDLAVLALSLDAGDAEKPKQFFRENRIRALAFFHDSQGAVFRALQQAGLINGLPASFLLDKNGCVLGTLAGPADWKSKEALELIDAAEKLTR